MPDTFMSTSNSRDSLVLLPTTSYQYRIKQLLRSRNPTLSHTPPARPILCPRSGGLGQIDHNHLHKAPPEINMLVVKIGGPAYRIGMGGGAASSVPSGSRGKADLDFNAVQVSAQRSAAQRRCWFLFLFVYAERLPLLLSGTALCTAGGCFVTPPHDLKTVHKPEKLPIRWIMLVPSLPQRGDAQMAQPFPL